MFRSLLQQVSANTQQSIAVVSPFTCIYTNLAIENWLYSNLVFAGCGSSEVHPKLYLEHLEKFDLPRELGDSKSAEAIKKRNKARVCGTAVTATTTSSSRDAGGAATATAGGGGGASCAFKKSTAGAGSHNQQEIIFLYRNDPCLVLGRNQNPYVECNFDAMEKTSTAGNEIHFARRLSGGGTVYHDLGNINISVLSTRKHHSPGRNMERLSRYLSNSGGLSSAPSLQSSSPLSPAALLLGDIEHAAVPIDAPLIPPTMFPALPDLTDRLTTSKRHDLFLDGRKITGSAMKLGSDVAYHHYTLLVSSDRAEIGRYLSPKSRVSEVKQGKATITRVSDLNGFAQVDGVGVQSVPSPVTTLDLAGWFRPELLPSTTPRTTSSPTTADTNDAAANRRSSLAVQTMHEVAKHLAHQNTSSSSNYNNRNCKDVAKEDEGKDGTQMLHVSPDLSSEEPEIWADIVKSRDEWMQPAWLYRCSGYTTYLDIGAVPGAGAYLLPPRSTGVSSSNKVENLQLKTHVERGGITKVEVVTSGSSSSSSPLTPVAEEHISTSPGFLEKLKGTTPFLDTTRGGGSGLLDVKDQIVLASSWDGERSSSPQHDNRKVLPVIDAWWHAHRPRGTPKRSVK